MRSLSFSLCLFAIAGLLECSPCIGDDADAGSDRIEVLREFIGTNCLECHSEDEPQGNIDLETLPHSTPDLLQGNINTEPLERVLRRIRTRQMPPADASRPTEAEYARIESTLTELLRDHATRFRNPGRTNSIRRLTRTEYQNAIRDLVAIEINAAELLPPDESSHGFDNITVDELSPMLISRYVNAAQKISRLVIGQNQNAPTGVTVRVPADQSQENHVEGLPLGTRGGTLVQHHFPQSGLYEVELRLTRDRDEKVEGLHESHQIDVLLDRNRVHRFQIHPPPGRKDYTHVDSHLTTRIRVEAGPHQVGITFPKKFGSLQETKRQPFDANYNRHRHPRLTPALFQVSIVGPFADETSKSKTVDTPSRQRVLSHHPGEGDSEADAFKIAQTNLRIVMRRAYRRPITAQDLESPIWFFREGFREGGFDAGMESALTSILVSPHFLLRIEEDPPQVKRGDVYTIDSFELASRLAFFIWSSIPDDRLLNLAERNVLSRPDVLRGEVERMLQDPKSRSLVDNFASQWLYLRNLDSITPDLRLFPDFDDNLRQAFRRETELLFEDVMKHDQSVLKLIDSDDTFLNQRLAKHYGIPGIFGSQFRRVSLNEIQDQSADRRGGILRHGSILTVTSYATRTSPTIRGHWILKNILGTPTPPPPPNVPNLEEKSTTAATTVRERLAQHRADPACASCHDLMDPLGFALENYDALGRWRNFDGTLDIDSRGTLPDGREIQGVESLEAGILVRPHIFVGTLTEKLLTYALGRGVGYSDGPAIRQIVQESSEKDYSFQSLIQAIVLSPPFQMRTAE